ncbi:Cytochrome c-type protein NrfH [Saezia sanguinis]|uniref:Cytochrome c-type protein NrfH n=1 Tax=Saezia sanguinis TaxID=1965230 RepID=A0A433SAN3_9BURK|nr:cytochrome c nitrite reductase small subunit [Saezia sanguinis]RUS65807.1 Cytochrome c-type protein NrfH [Saezia sanguinis]
MKRFLSRLPDKLIVPLFVVLGILAGLGGYTLYMSRAHTYLSDDPAACVNCHVMAPYYQSWSRSSHAVWTNCNDCHSPNNNVISKYTFKAADGLYHAAIYTFGAEPQVIRPRAGSYSVIMDNCVRCHTQLNTEFVKTGTISYSDVEHGQGKACWDCHRQVPHTNISNLASAPNAITPLPASPVPDWLKEAMK